MNQQLPCIMMLCVTLLPVGCASVPVELQEAMNKQAVEIERVKLLYMGNIEDLLTAVKKYRLSILNIYQKQIQAKYSRSFDVVMTPVGKKEPKEVEPVGDPHVDYLHLSTLAKIDSFFSKERENVYKDIDERRQQYRLIQRNFENVEQVNEAVTEYLESLGRLERARDAFATALKNKIVKIIPIPVSMPSLPDPSTIEDVLRAFDK